MLAGSRVNSRRRVLLHIVVAIRFVRNEEVLVVPGQTPLVLFEIGGLAIFLRSKRGNRTLNGEDILHTGHNTLDKNGLYLFTISFTFLKATYPVFPFPDRICVVHRPLYYYFSSS